MPGACWSNMLNTNWALAALGGVDNAFRKPGLWLNAAPQVHIGGQLCVSLRGPRLHSGVYPNQAPRIVPSLRSIDRGFCLYGCHHCVVPIPWLCYGLSTLALQSPCQMSLLWLSCLFTCSGFQEHKEQGMASCWLSLRLNRTPT